MFLGHYQEIVWSGSFRLEPQRIQSPSSMLPTNCLTTSDPLPCPSFGRTHQPSGHCWSNLSLVQPKRPHSYVSVPDTGPSFLTCQFIGNRQYRPLNNKKFRNIWLAARLTARVTTWACLAHQFSWGQLGPERQRWQCRRFYRFQTERRLIRLTNWTMSILWIPVRRSNRCYSQAVSHQIADCFV